MFLRAGAFNQDISSWNTSQVTDMRYMFKEAAAFYQDITGWTTTSLTTSTGMFTGATAWLDRVQRGDGTGTSGPISEWVHKPCLVNERAQSGWCVPCGGGGIRPAGDDPSSGDTMCAFPDTAALKAAVDACLSAVPSGEACCSTDTNCADPSSARCGSAGCVDMPDWDVSLVTDMQGCSVTTRNGSFNADISRGIPRRSRHEDVHDAAAFNQESVHGIRRRSRTCGTCSSTPPAFNQDIGSWDTSQVTDMRYMFQWRRRVQRSRRHLGYLAGAELVGHVPRRCRVQPRYRQLEYLAGDEHGFHVQIRRVTP